MEPILYEGVLMGLGATVVMNFWALLLYRSARIALHNWALVGRWTMYLPCG